MKRISSHMDGKNRVIQSSLHMERSDVWCVAASCFYFHRISRLGIYDVKTAEIKKKLEKVNITPCCGKNECSF